MTGNGWEGSAFEVRLGAPGHGGFCVARHEGRVMFVRHGLPGELVRAEVTEDRGGSFCRADAVQILEAAAGRVPATCPVSGPGGAGCCDFSFATPALQRELKAAVVAEQLRRLANWEPEVVVESIPSDRFDDAGAGGWRTRVRLVADREGHAGVHRHRSTDVLTDLRCPQPISGALDGIADSRWMPGAELVVVVDGDGLRHVVELAPTPAAARRGGDRRSTAARRSAAHAVRSERVAEGSGRAVEYVSGRRWEVAVTGFWQPHCGAAQCYSDVIADWSGASAGAAAWDLYSGAGVFAARLADQVGSAGSVLGVESSRGAVADGAAALRDLPQVRLAAERVERWTAGRSGSAPEVVVLDPPRAGAGKEVVAALAAAGPARIVHIGCDPAAFARDVSLYRAAGYRPTRLRAFDAFPATHHVECLALLEPA